MTASTLGPYAQAAQTYRQNGWLGVLPVTGKSENLPTAHTGREGTDPDATTISQWINGRGRDNVALRLPDTVLGIDVDAYDGRRGAETITWFEINVGSEFPATWRSTSREDDASGIYFFRVPGGMAWPSSLGRDSNVEIIRRAHRYAVVWPSVHPDTNRVYRWYRPDGTVSDEPPSIMDLPELPVPWRDAILSTGRGARESTRDRSTGEDGGGTGGGAVTGVGRPDHGDEDADTFDYDGRPVDVDDIFENGIEPGQQNNVLYAYLSSLRARNAKRIEMITLGWALIERCRNSRDDDPWTISDVVAKVDEVRRDYAPGANVSGLSPALREWAERLQHGQVGEDEAPPRDPFATDLGNTLRFARLMKDKVRYASDENRWYVWDGNRWAVDTTNQVLELTIQVVDDIRLDAMSEADADARAAWIRWAQQSENIARRKAVLDGAKGNPELVLTADQFDRDPWILVVKNGTIDLRTGELRPSDPNDLCTHQADVTYDPDADCPQWKEHIKFVTCDSRELGVYLMCMAGYSLTGLTSERAFWFLEGTGSNGKNVFVEPIMDVMGSYATAANNSLLTGGEDQHPTILADLRGKRFVFVDEVRQGKRLNVERIKALTGSKRVKARRMREDFFEFDAQFKIWVAGNGEPKIGDPSDGAWTRLKQIPFEAKVQSGQLKQDYARWLFDNEGSGILNWLLRGIEHWRSLTPQQRMALEPGKVKDATDEHRYVEDEVTQFVEEFGLTWTGNQHDVIAVPVLYQLYRNWALIDQGTKPADVLTNIAFGRRLGIKMGTKSTKQRMDGYPRPVNVYIGWTLAHG